MSAASATDTAVIEAAGLTKVFKDFWGRPKAHALTSVDFSVRRGQVFGLLGPNGSGKSTTVKLILGLLYPTRGNLRVLGKSPRDVDAKRFIGYLPEETYLYKYLTAAETLDFFGALFGLSAPERQQRTEQLLDMVGLTQATDRQVGEYSKGMARRIGLAQALINDPELVILDEPTSGLDPIGCREVKDVIKLLASRGKTVVLCSHLLADVEDVCDEVIVLYGGRVQAQGSLGDLLSVRDRTQITTPGLAPEELEQVLSLLREKLGPDGIEVSKPSIDLEEFFLDVVRKAREARISTSGAQAGGRIAEYLRAGETPAETTCVLESLLEETGTMEQAQAPEPALGETERKAQTELRLRELAPEVATGEVGSEAELSEPDQAKVQRADASREASRKLEKLLGERVGDRDNE